MTTNNVFEAARLVLSEGISNSDKRKPEYWLRVYGPGRYYKSANTFLKRLHFKRQEMQTGKKSDPIMDIDYIIANLAPKEGGVIAHWYSDLYKEHVVTFESGKWLYVESDKTPHMADTYTKLPFNMED